MAISSRKVFAEACVRQGQMFGVSPHYLAAAAQFRSGIADDTVTAADSKNSKIGPFRVTQEIWDANSADPDFESNLEAEDITTWRRQCIYAGLNAQRAQSRFIDEQNRFPSVSELYQAQWPDDPPPLDAALQAALDATAAEIEKAAASLFPDPLESPAVIPKIEDEAQAPVQKPSSVPVESSQKLFASKAPQLMEKLIDAFAISDFQAAGILGNLGHECGGFQLLQEKKPAGGRGGLGWAQWTGQRRDAFETFCRDKGLGFSSDQANLGFLIEELRTTQKPSIKKLKTAADLSQAVRFFEAEFEKAGIKRYPSRDRWAKLAFDLFSEIGKVFPAAVAKLLDPDTRFSVIATKKSGGSTYWLVNQSGEHGGQILIEEKAGGAAILKQDSMVFPLEAGLVPADTAAKLEKAASDSLQPPPPPPPPPPVNSDAQAAQAILSKAIASAGKLGTGNAPGTDHGNLACAWAVNRVVELALGKPVGGGLSTADMGAVLKKDHTRLATEAELAGGAIVISPAQGGKHGHVGIVGAVQTPRDATLIYSNSSSHRVFERNYTLGKWKATFAKGRGLPVLFYAVKKDAPG